MSNTLSYQIDIFGQMDDNRADRSVWFRHIARAVVVNAYQYGHSVRVYGFLAIWHDGTMNGWHRSSWPSEV